MDLSLNISFFRTFVKDVDGAQAAKSSIVSAINIFTNIFLFIKKLLYPELSGFVFEQQKALLARGKKRRDLVLGRDISSLINNADYF